MCRLLGIISKKKVSVENLFFNTNKPFKDFSCKPIGYGGYIHGDGWGIGWYENNKPEIFKEGKDEVKEYNFNKVRKIFSNIIVSHLRKASEGAKTSKNAHPFVYNNWIFAHNGFITRDKLLQLLDNKFKKIIEGDTDSEVFFLLIMQEYEKTNSIPSALKNVLKMIKKHPYKGLNFILTNGKQVYAYRNASPEVKEMYDYYSLNYLINKEDIIVSSEKLSQEDWNEVKIGELLEINNQLKITKVEVI